MNHKTIIDWRDALEKITIEQLPDYIIKTDKMHDDRIEIYLPEQENEKGAWPFMSVEVTTAGHIKYDRIRIFAHYRPIRDYKTDDQYARNIAKIVASVRAEHDNRIEEQNARVVEEKANRERKEMLEQLAITDAKCAFSNHETVKYRVFGNHKGGKIYIDFPNIKDDEDISWSCRLELEYAADSSNKLTWFIGGDMRVRIPDLAAFARIVY